jgi:hypothetical protein
MLGPDPCNTTCCLIQYSNRTVFDDVDAFSSGQSGKSRNGKPRLGKHVRGRCHRARKLAFHPGDHGLHTAAIEEARIQIVVGRGPHKIFERCHVLGRSSEIGYPGLAQANVLAALACKLTPQATRFDYDRQLVGISPLLPDPAPVARGLLRCDASLFEQSCLDISVGQKNGRRYPNDAAADYCDFGSRGDRSGMSDWIGLGKGKHWRVFCWSAPQPLASDPLSLKRSHTLSSAASHQFRFN